MIKRSDAAGAARQDSRYRHHWALGTGWVSSVAGVLLIVWLTWWQATGGTPWVGRHLPWLDPGTGPALPVALVAALVGLSVALRLRVGHGRYPFEWVSAAMAVGALALGGTTYGACDGSVLARLVGILNLFTGQIEPGILNGVGCLRYPSIFELARVLGLGAVLFSALAVLASIAQPGIERLATRFAIEVDVVVGLDAATLPLVAALCAEQRKRPAKRWYKRGWRRRGWRWPRPRWSRVVVLHASGSGPLVSQARTHGALVYVGVPTEQGVLRRIVLGPRGRVRLHRLYAFGPAQRENVAAVQAVAAIIGERRSPRDTRWLAHDTVPRLVARFTDVREARTFRLRSISAVGCLVDAVSSDGLLARALVDRMAEYEATGLAIIGDTPLALAVMEQLAQQRAFRHELQEARRPPFGLTTPEEGASNLVYQLSFDEVSVVADTAADFCEEWRTNRAPCSAMPRLLEARVAPTTSWQHVAEELAAHGGPRPVLLITEGASASVSTRATRFNAAHRDLLVLRPSANVQGVERLGGAAGDGPAASVPLRYGPTLMHDGRAPDDSWTVLARQEHESYCGWRSEYSAELAPARRVWEREADGLPAFFREDNLRQHRHLLMLAEAAGYEWRTSLESRPRAPELPREDLAWIAEREHERWSRFRIDNGWLPLGDRAAPSRAWMDERRFNANLVPWGTWTPEAESALQNWNIEQDRRIFERLWKWGVEPIARYERIGVVSAWYLTEPRMWFSESGDKLFSKAGDFWVVDAAGVGRGVAGRRFTELYEPTGRPNEYRRCGTVIARQVTAEEPVETLEGSAVAHAGMWIVSDAHGDSWAVPDDHFRATYRRVAKCG